MKEKTFVLKYRILCSLCKKPIGSANRKVEAISCEECSARNNKIKITPMSARE